jgi:hypothetical protein
MKIGNRHLLSLCAVVATMLMIFSPPSVQACGMAPPPWMYVGIAGEEALIVWNQATHTEQFIRRASFVGQASQFGFLVPTPTPPKLTEADSGVFDMMAGTYRPRIVPRPQHGLKLVSLFGPVFAGARGKALVTAAIEHERVSVLDSEQIAGYDAVVLRADDSATSDEMAGAERLRRPSSHNVLASALHHPALGHHRIQTGET